MIYKIFEIIAGKSGIQNKQQQGHYSFSDLIGFKYTNLIRNS